MHTTSWGQPAPRPELAVSPQQGRGNGETYAWPQAAGIIGLLSLGLWAGIWQVCAILF